MGKGTALGIRIISKRGEGMTKYRLTMNLKGVVKGANQGVTKGMTKVARFVQREIRKRAAVDTGYMKENTFVRAVGGMKPRIEVKTPYYGLFVEKGTVNMEAQPFITPVIHGMRRDIISRIAKEGRKETERAIRKRR